MSLVNGRCPECGANNEHPIIASIEVQIIYDDDFYPDYLKTEFDEEKQCIIESAQYSNEDIQTEGWETILGYIKEDQKRLQDFEDEKWYCVGIVTKAEVRYKTGETSRGTDWRIQHFESDGIWGWESSNNVDDTANEIEIQLESLKNHLDMFNVDLSNFDEKASQALEKYKDGNVTIKGDKEIY